MTFLGEVNFPLALGQKDRAAFAVMHDVVDVGREERFHLGVVVTFYPYRHVVGDRLEVDLNSISSSLGARLEHVELQDTHQADDPVGSDVWFEDLREAFFGPGLPAPGAAV